MLDLKNQDQLTKLIDLCRKKGVLSVKLTENSCELVMAEMSLLPKSSYRKKKEEKEAEEVGPYSEDETLFWSSSE